MNVSTILSPIVALLDWRNTPSEGVGSSPVQRLCGRRTRTLLPTTPSLLEPAVPTGVRDKLLKKKEIQTQYYNRGTRELPPLHKGDVVRMLPNPQAGKWKIRWMYVRMMYAWKMVECFTETEDTLGNPHNHQHLCNHPWKNLSSQENHYFSQQK